MRSLFAIVQIASASAHIALDLAEIDCEGPFYTRDANGSCALRSSPPPEWFVFGGSCKPLIFEKRFASHDQIIFDAASCNSIKANAIEAMGSLGVMGVYDTQFSDSTGCHAIAKNVIALGLPEVKTRACFGIFSWKWALLYQLFGALGGIFGSVMFVNCVEIEDHGEDRGDEVFFRPGSKLVAKNAMLRRYQGAYVFFYRSLEVIAQLWVPVVALWVYSPYIFCPLFFLLYWVPGACQSGFAIAGDPRWYFTPGHCGLLGIHESGSMPKERVFLVRFFFMCRPIAFPVLLMAATEVVQAFAKLKGEPIDHVSSFVVSDKTIYRLAFQNYWGEVLYLAVFWITIVGTVLYIVLTIKPLVKLVMNYDPEDDWIDFDINEEEAEKFEAMAMAICHAANEDIKDNGQRVKALHTATYTKWSTIFYVSLFLIDIASYVYKVGTLMADASYIAAGGLTLCLCNLLTTLFLHGHWKRAKTAFNRTVNSGIPSRSFLGIVHGDDMAGIPSLALSVYGLPLIHNPSPWIALISFVFLLTGTRAAAIYLSDVCDSAMYEVPDNSLISDAQKVISSLCGPREEMCGAREMCGATEMCGAPSETSDAEATMEDEATQLLLKA